MRTSRIALGVLALALAMPAAPAAAAQPVQPSMKQVLLPTGDHVIVHTLASGGTATSVVPGGQGIGHTYIALTLNGHHYEIPASAVPYLNNGLDLSLFDVTALAAANNADKVPVTVSGAAAAVPGLTAGGYLDANGAKEFGAAVTKQYLADKAKAVKPALFGGDVRVAAPGASTPVTPHFPMHTVTLAGNDMDGTPDNGGLAILVNVDDAARYAAPNEMYQGTAKFSVPDGNYFAAVVYYDTDADGNVTAEHDVFNSQLKVAGDQTIRMDAKKATSRLTMVTPRPTENSGGAFYLMRTDATGRPVGMELGFGAGTPVWVSPQPTPVSVGSIHSYPQVWLTSPPGPGTPYVYNLQYLATGTIPAQRYVVRAKDLATIDTSFYSDYSTAGLFLVSTVFPFEAQYGIGADLGVQQNMPAAETIYVPGDPTIARNAESVKYTVAAQGSTWFFGIQHSVLANYHAGQVVTENWNKFPLHTTATAGPGADKNALIVAGATRSGDTESFFLTPFSDNQPGHAGIGLWGDPRDTVSGSWRLDQNGAKVSDGPLSAGTLQFDRQIPVAAESSTLHLTVDANRTGPMYTLGTATHTEWTWPSAHQEGGSLPAPWLCSSQGSDTKCAVEPLMTVAYDVSNMDLTGAVSPSLTQGVDLTFGHLDQAAVSAITDASVQFSTDDGATWQDATVSATGNGKFHASFVVNATRPDELVTLRTTAHDAAGGAITETLTRAYALY
ncbi:hypothetical protein [Kutzneria sp. NPDC052558]|uniref:hypothetical protein n=1 Tax=Kutzneria sp. NPDC052558 TaxID=3364121 RepID=UPI0037CAE921